MPLDSHSSSPPRSRIPLGRPINCPSSRDSLTSEKKFYLSSFPVRLQSVFDAVNGSRESFVFSWVNVFCVTLWANGRDFPLLGIIFLRELRLKGTVCDLNLRKCTLEVKLGTKPSAIELQYRLNLVQMR